MLKLDKWDGLFKEVIDLLKESGRVDIGIMKGLDGLGDVESKFGKYVDEVI